MSTSDCDDIIEALSSSYVLTIVHGILNVDTILSSLKTLFDRVLLYYFLSILFFFYFIFGVYYAGISLSQIYWCVVSTVVYRSIGSVFIIPFFVMIYLSSNGKPSNANSALK